MSEHPDAVERAVEVLVFAPIGAGLYLVEAAPSFLGRCVARGRAEVDRRNEELQRHVTTARSTGQVFMAFGLPKLRQKVEARVEELVAPVTNGTAPPAPRPMEVVPEPESEAEPAPPASPWVPAAEMPDAPSRDDLPIPGYDTLSASQVVERLVGLAPNELDTVHAYEAAHRQRRTILGKIEQLAG